MNVDNMVLAGAAWLDQHRPGWDSDLNLDNLNIDSAYSCVLGQLYGGGYWGAINREGLAHTEAAMLGFTSDQVPAPNLEQAWRALVEKRRESQPDAPAATPVRLELTREDVALLHKRFKQIDNPNHTLLSTELEIGGVVVVLR